MPKKKDILEPKTIEPEQLKPNTPTEVQKRAWLYYSRQKFDLAEADFITAMNADPQNLDAIFGLSLTLKAKGETQKAAEYFEQALALVPLIEDKQRASIMHRLLVGQINQIKTGDWNLEKEVWHTDH